MNISSDITGYAAGIYAPAAIISPCCPFNGMIGVRKRRRRSLSSSLIMVGIK
jgi:hypothetical protein